MNEVDKYLPKHLQEKEDLEEARGVLDIMIADQTLTDSSRVYNIILFYDQERMEFPMPDEKSAEKFQDGLHKLCKKNGIKSQEIDNRS